MRATSIDPGVELLADLPITTSQEDLLDRGLIALRIAELAVAPPVTAPRMVALSGSPGSGKSSVLRLVSANISARAGLAMITIDAAHHQAASVVVSTMVGELAKLFDALGVVEAKDKLRNTLTSYSGMVSSIVRLAGVKVDVAGALERSAESLRAEIAQNLEQAGKRLVIIIDHLDRLPHKEFADALVALQMYAAIPYASIVIALDRHELATRPVAVTDCSGAFERIVQVELALPAADRTLLARVMVSGVERIAGRIARNLDDAIALFDPDGGLGLDLIESPRDAKRALNALAAALPLLTPEADVGGSALEVVLRVIIPEIDGVRLESRHWTGNHEALYRDLAAGLAANRRCAAGCAALRFLIR